MDEIRFGDRLASFNAQGKKGFSTVYSFATAYPNRTILAVQVRLNVGEITLSETHLLFASHIEGQAPKAIRASSLKPNMFLWKEFGKEGFKPVKITSVERVWRTGFFAPLTESGTMVVNGIASSVHVTCKLTTASISRYVESNINDLAFVALDSHDVMDKLYSLLRAWYYFFPEPTGELPKKYVQKHAFSVIVDRSLASMYEMGLMAMSM